MTTLAAWQRHAHRFVTSHWLALEGTSGTSPGVAGEGNSTLGPEPASLTGATPILALVEGDEGAHLALESNADFQSLPHPLAQKPISAAAQSALVTGGVAIPDGATTFEAAEALARVHPLLRHRVF